ncbi:glycosyltransferase involved in cell wall biosynthesis [Cryobacterium mesophilum]|uniref:glycosyltransferase family 2 protein n=1 Tax=Terrimesophilobacter mesophilus TaxID=433647 RepID=UPI00142551B6|nr:glycosyltransferase family A protein [Terrimesophilobacter mesophilus]MBB5631919.1 glycosyltransferase involved in cell wall biosynthesis [Terrimesophilobacter mesophilus]
MTEAKISVILPYYNGAAFISGALASILRQSVAPHEVMVINDGSTEEASAALRTAIDMHSDALTIHLIEQENQGQSASRNRGVDAATGDLMAFLDQDDEWRPEHLAHLSAPFESSPELGWTYSDFDEIDGQGKIVTRQFIRAHRSHHPKLSILEILGEDLMILPSASMLRKSAIEQVGGFDPRLRGYEDDDLFIRMFQAGWTSRFLGEALTRFRVHQGSSSDNSSFRNSRMVFFEKMSTEFPDDFRLNRLYISDLLVPRLLASTVSEYSTALQLRQDAEVRRIAESIGILLAGRHRVRLRSRLGVQVLRRPRLCRTILRLSQSLPRFLRPSISPALLPWG